MMNHPQKPKSERDDPQLAEDSFEVDAETAVRWSLAELEILRVQTNAMLNESSNDDDLTVRDLSPFGR
jgi:hypothetical protein